MKIIIFCIIILLCSTANNANAQDDTITTESGLKYIILEKGSGEMAIKDMTVQVHYTGYLIDGKVFDSSVERNEPIEFVLGQQQVIRGWDEGIALMSVGDKFRLIIPPDLAYGDKGAGNVIPPNAVLIFDTELVSVSETKESIMGILMELIMANDIDGAISKYNELKTNSPDKYNFKENQLNALGYQLLNIGKNKEAIEILKLNVQSYPNSSNVYDSLGEAYMINGDTNEAIENYKKSLELNPANKNAEEMLKKLGS
ncbi:MAG TPA: FKBP-type peptidyl-prolyl cis-trans isomerase [Ignavibacteria bacterium]|nr:FKBP-type peptidyl-prolyl cis-trans isomerase [Ignavibacteria bacterium]HMR41897.1 FKBP-type peptidyl-prolyl cis-trans isomerase [Ignavibacteria bacterium]